MINLETIANEIEEIEATRDTTYRTCERLAWLYVVYDHLSSKRREDATTDEMQGSEFLRACSGVNVISLMRILDEHMSAIAVTQPNVYESLMDKIRALR